MMFTRLNRVFLAAVVACLPMGLQAAGLVDFLEVEGDVVVFSTTETFDSAPACVSAENQDKFAISIASQSGRSIYTMLVTAMSMGLPVNVEAAGVCETLGNAEDVTRVWFAK